MQKLHSILVNCATTQAQNGAQKQEAVNMSANEEFMESMIDA